jgi:hypothetical protein
MADPRTDEIAREAARLIHTGSADDIDEALHLAAASLGYASARLPGHGRVRKHARAMTMQAIGDAAYHQQVRHIWEVAEQIMTVSEHTMPDVETVLSGRAAEGLIDAGVSIHVRLYTRHSDIDLARALVEFGYDQPQFTSIDTRFGRLQQMRLIEDGIDIALTRCMPELAVHASTDLTTGKAIKTLSLNALRRKLG